MRLNRLFAFAALLALPAIAFALTPVLTRNCDTWKDSEIRCLLDSSKYPTATIDITNTDSKNVTFTVDEWHSRCGTPGGKVESNRYDNLAGGSSWKMNAQNPGTDPSGNQITCREIFLHGCTKDGASVNCKDVLTAKYTLWKGNQQ